MQQLDEFKKRLARTVNKATCDVMPSEQFNAYIQSLTRDDLLVLARVLHGEIGQLRDDVLSQQ